MKRWIGLFCALAVVASTLLLKKEESLHLPKVYDCFLFFNEFELLKIRLSEMAPYVDKFVIVEATETFRGDPKPLYFDENRHLFKEWEDKIIHIVVNDRVRVKKPMDRERFQRNQLLRGLKKCHNYDIILISDVDEIVRSSDMHKIIQPLVSQQARTVLCQQKMYICHLNRYKSMWPGTTAATFYELKKRYDSSLTLLRERRSKDASHIVENAGWHFSYMGGIEQMLKKLAAFSHPKIDTPEHRQYYIDEFLSSQPAEVIDASFPAYIVKNQQALKELGWIY